MDRDERTCASSGHLAGGDQRGEHGPVFGSEAGGKAAAIAYTLIETAKLNGIDPHAWLADTIARIPGDGQEGGRSQSLEMDGGRI